MVDKGHSTCKLLVEEVGINRHNLLEFEDEFVQVLFLNAKFSDQNAKFLNLLLPNLI